MALSDIYLDSAEERRKKLEEIRRQKMYEGTTGSIYSPMTNYEEVPFKIPGQVPNVPQEETPAPATPNLAQTIRETTPDVWRGNIYEPGTVSTPEEQAYNQRFSERMIAGNIMKSVPYTKEFGPYKRTGYKTVPDTLERAKALEAIETRAAGLEEERIKQETEEKKLAGQAGQTIEVGVGKGRQQKMQWNPETRQYDIPVGKPYAQFAPTQAGQLTMTDVKSAHTMALNNIKNRAMIDMTPEDQSMVANQSPENLAALFLSGSMRSLPAAKKQQYIKEIQSIDDYYGKLGDQVMGRKGAQLPTRGTPTGGKTLTESTARAILEEAGGDKNKARQIARERGYEF